MSTEFIGFRCPQDLFQIIKEQENTTDLNKTAVVVNMLRGAAIFSLPLKERINLPGIPAIYWIFTPSLKLLYLGITDDLNRRLGNHNHYQDFIERSEKARIGWFEIDPNHPPKIEPELLKFSVDTEIKDTNDLASIEEKIADLKRMIEKNSSEIAVFSELTPKIEKLYDSFFE